MDLPKIPEQKISQKRVIPKRYLLHILHELHIGNLGLHDFFMKLDNSLKEISDEQINKYLEEIRTHLSTIESRMPEKNDLEEKLRNSGVRLDQPVEYSLIVGHYELDGSSERNVSIFQQANGCPINSKILTEEGLQEYKDEYESALRINSSCDKKEEELNRIIQENKRKLRSIFSVFLMKKRQDIITEIELCNDELDNVRVNRRNTEKMKQDIDVVALLTPEQKALLIQYESVTSEIITISNMIESINKKIVDSKILMERSELLSETHSDNVRQLMQVAFQKMVVKEGMTKEDIFNIFSIFRSIENKYKETNHPNGVLTVKGNASNTYQRLVEPVLQYIYEPEKNFEEQEFFKYTIKKLGLSAPNDEKKRTVRDSTENIK